MKHIQILYKRCVIFPLSGVRYPTGAGVGQAAGKPGKGSKNSPLNKKKKKSSLDSNTENKP